MLKLYTDRSFLTEEHRRYVFPLLFDLHFVKNQKLSDYYILTDDVRESDIVVFPIDCTKFLKYDNASKKLIKNANENNKPIWIYTAGDYGYTSHIKNSYTFRLGGFDSKLSMSDIIMPYFVNDPYNKNYLPQFSTLDKEEHPNIGFVGHAKSGSLKYLKEIFNYLKYRFKRKLKLITADLQSFYPSSVKRSSYLKILQSSSFLKTNFILRDKYRAGVKDEKSRIKTSQEFYKNMFDNAYTFCCRGVGNFSVRFYETLAVGRIPILLNTDCRLPLSHTIDWKKYCIIVEDAQSQSLEKQILNFHNSKSDKEFRDIQINNRKLWEDYLTRYNFFINIHHLFLKQIKKSE